MYCRASGAGTGAISRELALDMAEAVYRPGIGTHIPGVANVTADALSRLFGPDSKYSIPQ